MRLPLGLRYAILSASLLAATGTPVHALTWNVTYGSGLAAGTAKRTAFDDALKFWSSKMSDNVTVPFTADFSSDTSDPYQLGGTSANYYSNSYANVRAGLISDAADESDDKITASLPTTFSAKVNSGLTLSTTTYMTRTNARALGFITNANTNTDGDIKFYNEKYFDFDRSNGVGSGQEDFYSVVVHELGHLMGFVSSVDDAYYDATTTDASKTFNVNPLDFYRFSGNTGAPSDAATFSSTQRDLQYGVASHFDDAVSDFAFDNAVNEQASHWLDTSGATNGPGYVGVMDPTLSDGVVANVTYADYRAFDLIGWDLNAAAAVPEPTTLVAAAAVGAALIARRRRA